MATRNKSRQGRNVLVHVPPRGPNKSAFTATEDSDIHHVFIGIIKKHSLKKMFYKLKQQEAERLHLFASLSPFSRLRRKSLN